MLHRFLERAVVSRMLDRIKMHKMDSYDVASNNFRHIESYFNVKVSLSMLRYVGNWPPHGHYRTIYFFYTILSFFCVPAIYVFIQAAYVVDVWGDIDKIIGVSFLLMTNTGHSYKIIKIIVNQKRIQSLLDIMSSKIFISDNVKYERIFTWYTWNGIFHHAAYQTFGGAAVLCWSYAPIVEFVSGRARRLPVESWYPYDTEKSPLFEITYAHQIISVIILSLHHVAIDTFATNLMNVACCQFEILKRNIEAIGDDEISDSSTFEKDEACRRLNYCIKHNEVIVNFVTEIQDIFGIAIVYHCFVNCIILCLTAFHISQMKDYVLAEMIGTTMYLIAVIYQIFIFCWHGNELALQSESVSKAAYTGNWWKFDGRYKSTLGIVILCCQKPVIIKAGGIMTISLDAFMSILRMSYSLFTVLQSSRTD